MQTLDFERLTIQLFLIEHNGAKDAIEAFLAPKGYRNVDHIDGLDEQWDAYDAVLQPVCM